MRKPETSSSKTSKEMNIKNHLVINYHYFLVAILTIGLAMVFTNHQVSAEKSDSAFSIKTIYHVFYGDERVGIVDDRNVISSYTEEIVSELNEKYSDLDFTIEKKILFIPERVFDNRSFNHETLDLLEDMIEVNAKTYEISIGEDIVGHISRQEEVENLLRDLKLQYVSEEELAAFEERNESNNDSLKVGKSKIIDIRLSEQIEWKQSSVSPDEVITADQLLKKLLEGTLEKEVYQVEPGDVLGTIAEKHDLSVEDILSLNSDVKEDGLLQIGEELNVTVLKPMVTVIVEKATKKEEEIPFKTETKEDSSMWKGNTKVTQEGKEGKKITEYAITYENGRSTKRGVISEEVVSEPVNKVIVKGTKVSPSRGTGQLAWPAVGGYISSHQGNRWGSYHKGIDIARPSNYNILAADNGTVKSAGWENGYGYTIRINHNNGIETVYAHLASMDVSAGQTVGKGQKIGRMGSTGNSTGIHLHFEVYQNGALKNPVNFLNR